MDPHPDTDLDAPLSNPDEEEDHADDHYESGDGGEEEEEDLENEDPSGVNAPLPLLSSELTADFYRRSQEQQIEDRKRLEREFLAQKELLIKREESPYNLGGSNTNNGHSSKSTTPSPASPPQTQYLYAANHPFAAAAAAAFLNPSHMAAAAAAAAQAAAAAAVSAGAAHHAGALSSMGGSGGSTGSATPPNNGTGDDQSKYTFEEQFKQMIMMTAQHQPIGYHPPIITNTRLKGADGLAAEVAMMSPQKHDVLLSSFKKIKPKSAEVSEMITQTTTPTPQTIRTHPQIKPNLRSKCTEALASELYELSDDPRRKEFLDDLFNYMQKRGTPVNRIPIMAKQVLDLYELYRLVITRGGLVEVINKKIWREIVKGLNLPSSITSAAFTLRTQYMKYLYAYECHREKLSTAEELQAAIDGNRREGRRSSYGPYGDMVNQGMVPVSKNSPHPPMSSPLSLVSRHVNGHGSTPGVLSSGRGSASPLPLHYYTHNNSTSAPLPLNLAHQENGLYGSHGLSSGEDDNCNSISSIPNPMVMPQQEALNLEVSRNSSNVDQKPNIDQKPLNMKRKNHDEEENLMSGKHRLRLNEEERLLSRSTMPSTHIKITSSRGPDGRTQSDGSLMVSMEVNGIMYQGVLFAAPSHRNRL